MLSCSLALLLNAAMLCITNVSSILLRTNQPGKKDRKDSHHKLSALLSLIFGRSSSWCSMTKKATASSILLECHRIKKRHINHAFMLSCSLAPMLCITNVSNILLHTNQPGKEDRKDSHHKLSALLSLIFGRSSSWCSMTNKAASSLAFSGSSLFQSRGTFNKKWTYFLLAIPLAEDILCIGSKSFPSACCMRTLANCLPPESEKKHKSFSSMWGRGLEFSVSEEAYVFVVESTK